MKKKSRYLMVFFRVSFSRFTPSRQICPKCVPTIVVVVWLFVFPPLGVPIRRTRICPKLVEKRVFFRGSNPGDPNLSKICRKIEKFVRKLSGFFNKCLTNLGPPDLGPRKPIVGTSFGQIWGSGHF